MDHRRDALEAQSRELEQVELRVPPLEEKRRIAEILDTIDETIQATERVIAKLRRVRAGILRFECGTHAELLSLGSLATLLSGQHVDAEYCNDVGEGVREFVASKQSWIYRRLAEKDALIGPPIVKSFVPGEGFAYLGRSYRLALDDAGEDVRLDHGRFVMSADTARDGRDTMRRWYIATGQPWLQRRVIPWASRAGVETVEIDVRDLGYRWGSVRPTETPARINIHWATLQLPRSLIDYVLVLELAHLFEPNHTPELWAIVGRLMPGYDARKASLASIGKNVWLGQT